jgi:monomeric sarcosine oxidase
MNTFDTVVVGAGVFGSWTAWHLAARGQRVLLLDAYGIGHSRASSGGESRIIRMAYGPDEIYTHWSQDSLQQWKKLFAATGQQLFVPTGVLWLGGAKNPQLAASRQVLRSCGVNFESLDAPALAKRYPQINLDRIDEGIFEPDSGVLLARRAVACVVNDAIRADAQLRIAHATAPAGSKHVAKLELGSGESVSAGQFVFACGAWLPGIFPQLLGARIFPTRQEVFFFGIPAGDQRFASPALPTWLFQEDLVYGLPDIEGRGLKFARDAHGEPADPDTQSRILTPEAAAWARDYVARRFPALRDAPIVESRVCQYENSSNGDFLIDSHPDFDNVWLAGGGSGHGFKHGPAFGAYLAARICDNAKPEPRFSLETKATRQERAVY